MDKAEYWDIVNRLKARATSLVPTPTFSATYIAPSEQRAQERLDEAIRLVKSGMSRKDSCRLTHVGEDRLRRALKNG